ncbi:uncharacterized [Tachysurus ichikawai]
MRSKRSRRSGDSVMLEEEFAENTLFFCSPLNSMSTLFASERRKCDDPSVCCSDLRKHLHRKATVTVAECVISVAAPRKKEERGGKTEADDPNIADVFGELSQAGISDISSIGASANLEARRRLLWLLSYEKTPQMKRREPSQRFPPSRMRGETGAD